MSNNWNWRCNFYPSILSQMLLLVTVETEHQREQPRDETLILSNTLVPGSGDNLAQSPSCLHRSRIIFPYFWSIANMMEVIIFSLCCYLFVSFSEQSLQSTVRGCYSPCEGRILLKPKKNETCFWRKTWNVKMFHAEINLPCLTWNKHQHNL